jgi:arylsulfatase A-like enzyme
VVPVREALAILAVLALAACGSREPAPPRVRLTERAGTLRAPAAVPLEPRAALLREDFAAAPADWIVITDREDVLAVDATALRQTYGREGERTFLTLGGRAGALYCMLPVQGDTPYLFRGVLRARGVVPLARPFSGATFWIAEASLSGSPSELFEREKRFDRRLPVASAAGEEGWVSRTVAFRTGPRTRTLIVGCLLTVGEPIERGEVDFDEVVLERIPERELWEFEAAEAVAAAHRGAELPAAGAWAERRRVDAMVAAEQRPAVLCFPGERLEFELELPPGDPVFRCGLAPWPRAARAATGPLVYRVRVDGVECLRASTAPRAPADTSWQDVEVELDSYAGRRVRLELGLEGPLPGLFGSPEVLDRAAAPAGWNVLLVSIDTLRADRVGAYGAATGATPHVDALAREGVLFEDASANAPYTLPAHATLFSGQFARVHGVEDRGRLLSPGRSPVLARMLAARGYRTQAFAAGGFLAPDFGFHAGFDGFAIVDPLRHPGSRYFADFRREYPEQNPSAWEAEPGVERVKRWIGAHVDEAFFLFLHTYEVHDYDPPPGTTACASEGCTSSLADHRELLFPRRTEKLPGTPEDRAHLGHLYDAALRHVDAELGAILAELERLGLARRTLVVVTSDHGEELFERGHLQHGKTLYDEVLRIPLVLRVPGAAPRSVSTPAMQVDVAPTILAALGFPLDPRMQGLDLLGETRGPRSIWAEVDDHFVQKASLRLDGWKLVHGPQGAAVSIPNEREWELYDLAGDPGEQRDVAEREPARLAKLRAELEAFEAHLRVAGEALGPIESGSELDERMERLLDHLGYGGGE